MSEPRTCAKCGEARAASEYRRTPHRADGLRAECRLCEAAASRKARAEAAERRRASDYAALAPEDYDTSVANVGGIDPRAAKEKRQEYSELMGQFADAMAELRGEADRLPAPLGTYVGLLAEQERRFGNRRLARSVSLAAAHEALQLRQFKAACAEYLRDKIAPSGYATRSLPTSPPARAVVLLLSDLHFGSDLKGAEEPVPFGAVEEARRFEYVVTRTIEFKKRARDRTELVLLLGGDLIEGLLLHDLRTGAPLVEQKVIFWRLMGAALALFAEHFPTVRVVCQPGNHGRDRLRHPGRAIVQKWDGHEWEMYYALREASSALKNVAWDIGFRAVSVVDLLGAKLLLTHGDTEIRLGHPDNRAKENRSQLRAINSDRRYGSVFDVAAFGHYHCPRYQPGAPTDVLWNGALVPPHAWYRTMGFADEPCGQWLWEAVPGHPVGDLRFLEVGPEQDQDESLGTIIKPFRFEGVA